MAGMAGNGCKRLEMARHAGMALHDWIWLEMAGNGWKGVERLEMACYCWKWLEIAGTFFKCGFQKAGLAGIGWPDLINFIELIVRR